MTELLSAQGALAPLTIASAPVSAEVAEAIIGVPTLDLSTDQVSALSITVSDPALVLLKSGLFARSTKLTYSDLIFHVSTIELGGSDLPTLTIAALAAEAMRVTNQGPLVRLDLSPTEFIAAAAWSSALSFVGEPSAVRAHVARGEGTQGDETDWQAGQRLAKELGYIAFEAAGVYYFGRPTWLVARSGVKRWVVRYPTPTAPELASTSVPSCRRAVNNPDAQVAVGVTLPWATGKDARPGQVLELRGVPSFEATYLIRAVTIPLDGVSDVAIDASLPIDPVPEPSA